MSNLPILILFSWCWVIITAIFQLRPIISVKQRIPPHTSDHLQALDVTVFSPLKNFLYRQYELYLSTSEHQKITEYDVAELLTTHSCKKQQWKRLFLVSGLQGYFHLTLINSRKRILLLLTKQGISKLEVLMKLATSRQNNENSLSDSLTHSAINYIDPQPDTSKDVITLSSLWLQ
nr:unnamed protein product [Callosobruchus analis]